MTLQDAQSLVDYHYWARDRMLDAVEALTPEQYTKDLGSSFKSVRDTLVHTYSARMELVFTVDRRLADRACSIRGVPRRREPADRWTAQEAKIRLFVASRWRRQ